MTTTFSAERWLSGRKHRFAKPTYGDNSYRGFKSRSLRHFPKPFQCSKLKILHCLLTCALQLKVQLVWICSDAFDGVYQWQAVKIACMNGKIILGNGLTSLPFDFSMFLCEAYCAAEMEDVPRDLFDLWRWVAVFASSEQNYSDQPWCKV